MSPGDTFSKFFSKKESAYVRLYWAYIILQLFVLRTLWKSLGPPLIFLFELFVRTEGQDRVATIVGMIFIILLSAAILIPLGILGMGLQVRITIHPTNRTITQRYALGLRENTIARFT